MTDDVAFGAPSTFGGVIPTPALERIARDALRYPNFHSIALCSPARAALITGRKHHSAGFGVISGQATGDLGVERTLIRQGTNRQRLGNVATLATILGEAIGPDISRAKLWQRMAVKHDCGRCSVCNSLERLKAIERGELGQGSAPSNRRCSDLSSA